MISYKLNYILDFILPRFCESCIKNLTNTEEIICSECIKNFEIASEERIKNEFNRKFLKDKLISDFAAAFVFHDESEIQKLIHALKYDQKYLIGNFLGKNIASELQSKIKTWNADLIIPVPLHSLRKTDRGFNQAEEIAKGISKKLSIPHKSNIIKRNRYTETQTKLTLVERKKNIEDAFQLKHKNKVKDKNIIIVDDVITTGATISECASLLLEAGAKNVYALSVAIAN